MQQSSDGSQSNANCIFIKFNYSTHTTRPAWTRQKQWFPESTWRQINGKSCYPILIPLRQRRLAIKASVLGENFPLHRAACCVFQWNVIFPGVNFALRNFPQQLCSKIGWLFFYFFFPGCASSSLHPFSNKQTTTTKLCLWPPSYCFRLTKRRLAHRMSADKFLQMVL